TACGPFGRISEQSMGCFLGVTDRWALEPLGTPHAHEVGAGSGGTICPRVRGRLTASNEPRLRSRWQRVCLLGSAEACVRMPNRRPCPEADPVTTGPASRLGVALAPTEGRSPRLSRHDSR